MQTIIITGINGFVGQHLARQVHQNGYEIIGVGSASQAHPDLNVPLKAYYSRDLTERTALKDLPFEQANCIINLAGLANVGASFGQASLYEDVNVGILKNICDELLAQSLRSVRVLAISTGAVYDPKSPPPFDEDSPVVDADQTSPYVRSKLLMEDVAQQYNAKGLNCITVRPFNHIGPRQGPGFILPDLTQQLIAAKQSDQNTILVGNLRNKRDFTDVRDVARAYVALVQAKPSDLHHTVYNVCSGRGLEGNEILNLLENALGIKNITPKVNESLIRESDPALIIGSAQRLKTDTGWEPTIPIAQTITDFVAWYKSQPAT